MAKSTAFQARSTLRAIVRLVEADRWDALAARVDAIPDAHRAGFLWDHVADEALRDVTAIVEAAAATLAEVPLAVVAERLGELSEGSDEEVLPGVGLAAVELLVEADCGDAGPLFSRREELPRALQKALWCARGLRGDGPTSAPAALADEVRAEIVAHALEDDMAQLGVARVLGWFGLPLAEVQGELRAQLAATDGAIPWQTLGELYLDAPLEVLREVVPRADLDGLYADLWGAWDDEEEDEDEDAVEIVWAEDPRWLERRAHALPDEPLADRRAVLGLFAARLRDGELGSGPRQVLSQWCGDAARDLARAHVERGEPVPEALLGHFSKHTTALGGWWPVFSALADDRRRDLLETLRYTLTEASREELRPLELLVAGDRDPIATLIRELEAAVRRRKSVFDGKLLAPLGGLGAAAVAPLSARVAALAAALDPSALAVAEGYRPRAVLVALRSALAIALGDVARAGAPTGPALERALWPTPETLFAGSDDFLYSFFLGLERASALFEHLPDARVRAWVAAWRASPFTAGLEERLASVLPASRRALLRGGPALAERVAELAERTGLARTQPVYLLARSRRSAPAAATLNRVGPGITLGAEGLPQGLHPVLVLDLETVPELASAGARALALLVDEPAGGFEEAAVVALSPAECAAGITGGVAFAAERVLVPPEAFAGAPDAGSPLGALRRHIAQAPAYALGAPLWIQGAPPSGVEAGFVLGADEDFSGLGLGDEGQLYLYRDRAFWQSH